MERNNSPIEQPGTLDGAVIQIGGSDETVNVHLKVGGEIIHCVTNKPVAERLAQHLYSLPVRLAGIGVWSRAESGTWSLRRFTIADFETLDRTPLPKLFEGLRATHSTGPQHRAILTRIA